MNWVISKSKKIKFHTHLNEILKPIIDDISELNWLLSDLEFTFMEDYDHLPMNFNKDYSIVSSSEFNIILNTNIQIIWGVIIGIPQKYEIKIDERNIPYSEGNDDIWVDNNFQNENAEIEIICFDSSYTIVKFRNKELSDKFKAYFQEAISLEKFG